MAEDEAFPTLTDADMAVMDELGTRRKITAGEYLYREGDLTYDFMVVVSGSIDVVAANGKGGETTIVAQHGARKFLGELNLLSGMRVFVSARVAESGEIIAIPRDNLRRLIATSPGLGDTILTAFMARRSVLMSRRVGDDPPHRLAFLSTVPAGARVPGPLPHPLRVVGPR